MIISYAITVVNEIKEITSLINFLQPRIRIEDEIIIQYDKTGVTDEVMEYLNVIKNVHDTIKVVGFPLNDDFGTFKSNLKQHSKGDYILQLDADEIPHEYLLEILPNLLEENNEIDLFFIPRINTVDGLGYTHVKKWNWKISKLETHVAKKEMNFTSDEYRLLQENNLIINENEDEVEYYIPIINHPDYQTRLYKNTKEVQWLGKVHEKITGYSTFTALPTDEHYCLYHHKEIERQLAQNEFYDSL